MSDLVVVEKPAEWDRLKQLVLDSVSSPITKRVYNMALDEFLAWFKQAPRPGFPDEPDRDRRAEGVEVNHVRSLALQEAAERSGGVRVPVAVELAEITRPAPSRSVPAEPAHGQAVERVPPLPTGRRHQGLRPARAELTGQGLDVHLCAAHGIGGEAEGDVNDSDVRASWSAPTCPGRCRRRPG